MNTNLLRQSLMVSAVSLAALPQRRWSCLVIIVGMGCVVGVLLAMLSVTSGLTRMNRAGAPADRVIIVPRQADSEVQGGLSRDAAATILSAPGIARTSDGKPRGSAEVVTQLPPVEGFAEGSLGVRGVGPTGIALRSEFRIVSGRLFRRGLHELVVGEAARRMYGLKLGDTMILPDGDWPIVGIFAAGGGSLESQLLADIDTLMATLRTNDFGSVLLRLASPTDFDRFRQWVMTNPTLSVDVERQADYYVRRHSGVMGFFELIALTVVTLLAIGALFGSVNIMYGAVSARTREIGTLRAMGFGAVPIAVSVILEALVLSLLGAVLGACVAWFVSNGKLNAAGSPVFENYISPRLVAIGMVWALGLAVLGSLFPAIRAGRLSVAEALRAT